jgi:glucose-1-phosphate thymidylyltransferase
VVILGDNIFSDPIERYESPKSATIVVCEHAELKRFGVATFNNDELIDIEEKPKVLSDTFRQYAITGCYLFDQKYFDFFQNTTPSARGEFEICDIIKQYWMQGELDATLYNGELWSDAGTHDSIAYVNDYFYHKTQKA